MPRPLPIPQSLGDAVQQVIESNQNDGYQPTRFIQATEHGSAPDLLSVCLKLINKGETLEWIEAALNSHPDLLTLEDLVCSYGAQWGFDGATIQAACARSAWFNQVAGRTRYS